MNWTREVAHVAWKDVRQHRTALTLFLTLVVVATARAMLLPLGTGQSNVFEIVTIVVLLFACIVAAVLVQADSLGRPDAFWRSRPFRPAAILGAKLLLIITLILGLPLIGEIVAYVAFGVPSRYFPSLLSTSLSIFGLWLTLSLVLGALTSDLRSAVVAFVLVLIGFLLLTAFLTSQHAIRINVVGSRALLVALTFVAGVLTLIMVYFRRGWHWPAWVAASVTSFGCIAL